MLNRIDLARADLNLLVLFEAVLECRHVGRAAERLHLTPSAVSHGLGRLRRLLDDPLFLRTPKGVVPTARATDLAAPVAQVLAGARGILATAAPFDPARTTRRFTIGAPDGVSALILPPLLARLHAVAPGIDIGLRQLLPAAGQTAPEVAWRPALLELEARGIDVAILPMDNVPARFLRRTLFEDDFVVALRAGHPFAAEPTLDRYCAMRHLLVSLTGDAHGFVDAILADRGLARRVALTVPNFLFALAVLAETDLLAALPRRLVALYGPRHGVVGLDPPIPLGRFRLNAIVPRVALLDTGVAWLVGQLAQAEPPAPRQAPAGDRPSSPPRRRARTADSRSCGPGAP